MAEEKSEGGGPMQDLILVVGALLALIAVWFASGGPERADLRGIFLAPPAPLGTGDAYGPQVGEPGYYSPEYTNQ